MMRRALALVACVLLAGCAQGDGVGPVRLHVAHEYAAGEPRVSTFDVGADARRLVVTLSLSPLDAASCEVEEPARVSVLDPTGKEALSLVAEDCGGRRLEETVDARPGAWTILFDGRGGMVGAADVESLGEREPGTARVAG